MEERKYSIREVCEIVGEKEYTLRYIEKALNLEIERDESKNRWYSEEVLDTLKRVKKLKDQGLNYKGIKAIFETEEIMAMQDEVALTSEENNLILRDKEISISNEQLIKLQQFLTNIISKCIDDSVNNKIDSLENNLVDHLNELEEQNRKLKRTIDELELEQHFRELDDKLMRWQNSRVNRNKKSIFKRIFRK